MPNYYEIAPTDDTLTLRANKASASFTVRYVGDRTVEARAQAVALKGAKDDWLEVEAPTTREMEPNQTHNFKVKVAVPPGTPAGDYALRLDMVSVDNTDEEYDQGPTVSFRVEESEEPEPTGFPWWVLVLVAVLLIVIIAGATWWFTRDTDTATPIERPTPDPVEPQPVEPDEPVEPIRPDTLAGEDCLNINRDNLRIQPDGDRFLVTDGRSRMMLFERRENAQKAIRIIRHYHAGSRCFAIRPNAALQYLKTDAGDIPSGSMPDEDCIRLRNPDDLSIRRRSSDLYQVMDGNHIPFAARSREEAERVIEVVQHYNARFTCFVERPDPPMKYLRK